MDNKSIENDNYEVHRIHKSQYAVASYLRLSSLVKMPQRQKQEKKDAPIIRNAPYII